MWRRQQIEKAKDFPVYVYGIDKPFKYEEVFTETGEPLVPKQNEKQ